MKTARLGSMVVIALSLSLGCKGTRAGEAAQKEAFGAIAADDDVDFVPYLAMARAVVFHKDRPAQTAAPHATQRVFVTVYSRGTSVVTSALGDSLMSGVIAASEAAAAKLSAQNVNPEEARIKIDVASEVEPTAFETEVRMRAADSGVYGFLFRDANHTGFIVPSEIVTQRYLQLNAVDDGSVKVARDRLVATMAERAGVSTAELEAMPSAYRFKTTARVESSPPGSALAVHRAMLDRPAVLTPDDLLAAVRAGAEYLSRVINDKGRYAYMVHPVEDEGDKSYGMLRHAGSTYALLEAYGEFGNALFLEKAMLALGYLKSRFTVTPDGTYLSDAPDEEQQKAGGNGLALVALTKHATITGSKENMETMRNLARYMVHQQYPDGHFRNNADVTREDDSPHKKKLKKEVSYYPGEAILGLIRLYAIDPQPMWLDAAKKAAEYLIFVRDVHDDLDKQIHDHWLSYALNDLHRYAPNPAYPEHSFKIARAILKAMKTKETAPAPDYIGTFYDFAETTPASTRLEAFAADMELSRYMDKPIDWLEGPGMEMARYMRSQQLDTQSAFFVKDVNKVKGGVRESLANSDVRIDYVQHAMSAWLHLARVERDPAYGTAKAQSAQIVDAGVPDAREASK